MSDTGDTRIAESVVTSELKDRIVGALVMNGWGNVFGQWWRAYNQHRPVDQQAADRAEAAYVNALASDIVEALVNGHYPDGTCPHPAIPPALTDGDEGA